MGFIPSYRRDPLFLVWLELDPRLNDGLSGELNPSLVWLTWIQKLDNTPSNRTFPKYKTFSKLKDLEISPKRLDSMCRSLWAAAVVSWEGPLCGLRWTGSGPVFVLIRSEYPSTIIWSGINLERVRHLFLYTIVSFYSVLAHSPYHPVLQWRATPTTPSWRTYSVLLISLFQAELGWVNLPGAQTHDLWVMRSWRMEDTNAHTHRIQVLKTPFKHTEIILHSSSFDPAVLVFVVHVVSMKKNTQPE